MTVITVVALLVSIAVVEGMRCRGQANESNCMANLKAIACGFEVYAARHGGSYAPQDESNLQFLVDDGCLYQDFIAMGNLGNFNYLTGSITPGGYDIRAMARNASLSRHNYQISTCGILKRSDSSAS
ncbi:MAG: hypothetical protein Q8N85_04660, partial [Candidatus Omnitrophota bacterium]|nr:hypothetical protein [Candidatus Omnitrophota bacterium]